MNKLAKEKETFLSADSGIKKSFSGAELIIGLVGAVGTDLDAVVHDLTEFLADYGYESRELRVSQKVIPVLTKAPEHDTTKLYESKTRRNKRHGVRREFGGTCEIRILI